MKEYHVRRSAQCPTGEHTNADGATRDCTCPWLVVKSSHPVPHMMQWGERELKLLIKEFDSGYFDPNDFPERKNSMFISAHLQDLIRLAEQDPAGAVLRLLGPLPLTAIAWSPMSKVLSLRLRTLPGEAQDWAIFYPPGVEQVSSRSNLPGGLHPHILWEAVDGVAAEEFTPGMRSAIGQQVRALMATASPDPAADWTPTLNRDEPLVIDAEVVEPALSDPEAAALVAAEEERLTAALAASPIGEAVDEFLEDPSTGVRRARPKRRTSPKEDS